MNVQPRPRPAARRSIATPPPVVPKRLHGGRPILSPIGAHPWESGVVLNPAGVLVEAERLEALLPAWGLSDAEADALREAGGACVLLYRAQGAVDPRLRMAPSSLGWAVFTPDMRPVARKPEPALAPDAPFHNLGLEDARCTRIGDTYYLYYTGYTDPSPEDDHDRHVHICLATSDDLAAWTLHGPAEGDLNVYNNKNSALLPELVDGQYVMLHRPMEGPDAMAVHWAVAPSPAGPWTSRGMLFKSYRYREFAQSWVGAGGPPLALGHGRFLMIYHLGHYAHDGSREYDLAAGLLDFSYPEPVRARIEPLMRPTGSREQEGDADLGVDNVLFTCANHRWQGDVVIPYAGADSRIFAAAVSEAALVAALEARA
ncbi:MAG: glycosidase [Rubricoccaceae bacterium]